MRWCLSSWFIVVYVIVSILDQPDPWRSRDSICLLVKIPLLLSSVLTAQPSPSCLPHLSPAVGTVIPSCQECSWRWAPGGRFLSASWHLSFSLRLIFSATSSGVGVVRKPRRLIGPERGRFEQAEELGSPTLRSLPCFSDRAPSTAEGPGDSPGVIMSAFCLESSLPDSSPSTTAFVLSMPGCKLKPDHPHHPEKNAKNDDNAVSLWVS